MGRVTNPGLGAIENLIRWTEARSLTFNVRLLMNGVGPAVFAVMRTVVSVACVAFARGARARSNQAIIKGEFFMRQVGRKGRFRVAAWVIRRMGRRGSPSAPAANDIRLCRTEWPKGNY